MIEVISGVLLFIGGPEYSSSRSQQGLRMDADMILSHIEDSGMKPPDYVRYVDQPNGNTLCSEESGWEPEEDAE